MWFDVGHGTCTLEEGRKWYPTEGPRLYGGSEGVVESKGSRVNREVHAIFT